MLVANNKKQFLDTTASQLFKQALCANLRFIPRRSAKLEAAIDDLVWSLGISGQRPESAYNGEPETSGHCPVQHS